jgi:bifunctional DNase/RNase
MIKEARIASVMSLFPLPQYVVVLEDMDKTRLVPIWIGLSEGNAIALELQGERFPRPLTHDLIVNLLSCLNATVEKVVVSDLKDNSYYAVLHLKANGQNLVIDARPSDSLAIAVRVHCPIFIDEKVLNKCRTVESPITKAEIEKFKDQLKTLTPEEFFKSLEKDPPEQEPPEGYEGPEDQGSEEEEGDDEKNS